MKGYLHPRWHLVKPIDLRSKSCMCCILETGLWGPLLQIYLYKSSTITRSLGKVWLEILVPNLATNFQDLVAKVNNLVVLAPVLDAILRPKFWVFFPSKMTEFLHVVSNWNGKHHPVFFFRWFAPRFWEITCVKSPPFSLASSGDLLLHKKQKTSFVSLSKLIFINPLHPRSLLIDFTPSNARQIYLSKGELLGLKGLKSYLP